MSGYPEPLEYIFQQVERDTERRAQEELARNELLVGEPSELFQTVDSSATYKAKRRRRGSISITRVGQLPDDRPQTAQGLFTNKRFSTIAEGSPFYPGNDSVDTLYSEGDGHQDLEDEEHTTQVQITGSTSLSKAMQAFLPRQLTRSRSVNVVSSLDANMVIGVSVQKSTVQVESKKDEVLSRASVHPGRNLRKQSSTLSMSASSPAKKGWVEKAKGFTRRFRRTKNLSKPANPVPS